MVANMNSNFTQQLISHLLINYNQISNFGLMNGKMGGVIFFMLYAHQTKINAYHNYCSDLLEDIYEQISISSPIGLYDGLCGIGWGIEFLIQNNLTEGNTDELLEDIDLFIMEKCPSQMTDRSLETGLSGILFYVNARLKSFQRQDSTTPFSKEYLTSLQNTVNEIHPKGNNISKDLVTEFNIIMQGTVDYQTPPSLPQFMFVGLPEDITEMKFYPLGIANGLTGVALKSLII